MFSGIIETTGELISIHKEGSNIHFDIKSPISSEAYIDQSIAHDGVCLTVVAQNNDMHRVTAIDETLSLSTLNQWKIGGSVNLERCVKANQRMDGHFVQGHVDSTAQCTKIESLDGSWYFTFKYDESFAKLLVSKGSITINGVSLTVIKPSNNSFKVGIIPYTYEHTNFHLLGEEQWVNIEFDILGKYIQRHLAK